MTLLKPPPLKMHGMCLCDVVPKTARLIFYSIPQSSHSCWPVVTKTEGGFLRLQYCASCLQDLVGTFGSLFANCSKYFPEFARAQSVHLMNVPHPRSLHLHTVVVVVCISRAILSHVSKPEYVFQNPYLAFTKTRIWFFVKPECVLYKNRMRV